MELLEGAGLIRRTRSILDGRGLLIAIEPRMHGRITAWLAGTEIGRPARTD